MQPDILISPGSSTTLNPNITGAVTGYEWSPPAGLSNPAIINPLASPSITTTYLLKVKSPDGCESQASTTVIVEKKLLMPSAFTPNGDGKNDVFAIPPGTTLTLQRFSVYNRAGQIIFTTRDINKGWDGTYKGILSPPGVYVFQVQGSDPSGKIFAKGTVMLIR